jgi:hypothetical protein
MVFRKLLGDGRFTAGRHNLADSPVPQSTLGTRHPIRRTVPRYSFIGVAQIETTTDPCVVGKVSEISRKGCYVDIQNPPSLSTLLHLVLSRDGGTFATKGKVIYVEANGMGVAFVDPTDEQLRLLDSWLAERAGSDTATPR